MNTKMFVALCALCAGVLFTACQKDDLVGHKNDEITVRQPPPPCSNGNPSWTTDGSLCAGDDFTVNFCVNATCGQLQLQKETSPGVWEQATPNEQPTDGCISVTFTAAAAGTYNFRAAYNGSAGGCGQNVCNVGFADATYSVVVVECGCETSFTGEAQSCDNTRSATYTFVHEDDQDYVKIQGGLTNFTGADAAVWINGVAVVFNSVSGDGWTTGTADGYTVGQRTPGMSSNRNIRVEGATEACEELVIYIEWNSTNSSGVITGDWSAVDENGTALASDVSGLECL